MKAVLGCLKYILEKAASMSPERSNGGQQQGDIDGTDIADDVIDLDDNDFTNPPNEEDDEEGEED